MAPFADAFIEQHFQAWLDRYYGYDEERKEEAERKIRAFCATETTEYWGNKSWPELRDMAGA